MPVMINGVEISDDAVFNEMQYHPAESAEDAKMAAAQSLVIQELLRQEAGKQGYLSDDAGLEDTDAVEAAVMQLIEAEVTCPEADIQTCRHYYDVNLERFRAVDQPDRVVSFESVADKIRDYLHTQSVREGVRAYVLDLSAKARISGFKFAEG